ncbi:BAG family molecular chaperone regulator 1-like [Macadamia integrifolia]|uniref:BAG family molecular chaperone regulator 1-like n=1 Tax=Macadamia integrifolia TaxID=60698 RepID=UPI001C4FEE49|nr:BAG family molecular chaperone regulator 1-like [Macadamia integrifolia]
MIKLRAKRFCRSNSKLNGNGGGGGRGETAGRGCGGGGVSGEIKWELRPGGLLVQKRDNGNIVGEGMITLRVSTVTQWHDISIQPTSTFGELKMILSVVTGLEAREQRVLYKGKEREDEEFLHMVGVKDMDKVLVLEDPAIKERKLLHALSSNRNQAIDHNPHLHTISV